MDFKLPTEVEALRVRVAAFVRDRIVPLEADRANYDEHENVRVDVLDRMRAEVKAAGLWAPQVPKELGGLGLDVVARAALYEEMNWSIFGPACFNAAAPDDGNMTVLAKVATPAQKARWLAPIVAGRVRSAFAMTEPHPGSGSDPAMMLTRAERRGDRWVVHGRKWFITGAEAAQHFILIAKTGDDPRRGLSAFMFDRDQPGWRIVRRIPIMGPEEHGGHCELVVRRPRDSRRRAPDGGGRRAQGHADPARHRAAHALHALDGSRETLARDRARLRRRCGRATAARWRRSTACRACSGEAAMHVEIGRLLTMRAAAKLDAGDFARKEISMAKVVVADALQRAVDTGIQLNGARGYSEGHGARVDLPLRAAGAPGRRRVGSAQGRAGRLPAQGARRVLAVGLAYPLSRA